MTAALVTAGVLVLCAASAVLGRLFLTYEEAWRTITVRVPALALLIFATAIIALFAGIFGIICFVGGSFYGLYLWWLPLLGQIFGNTQHIVRSIIAGRWVE